MKFKLERALVSFMICVKIPNIYHWLVIVVKRKCDGALRRSTWGSEVYIYCDTHGPQLTQIWPISGKHINKCLNRVSAKDGVGYMHTLSFCSSPAFRTLTSSLMYCAT